MKTEQLANFLAQAKTTLDIVRSKGGRALSQADTLERSVTNFKNGLEPLQNDNTTLTIGIVGQMNVGKSSFLNALMFDGKEVLPTAATPMTAGLTVLEYANSIESQRFEVEYYTRSDWDYIKANSKIVEEIKDNLIKDKPELASRSKQFELIQEIKRECSVEDYACYLLKTNATSEACDKIDKPRDVRKFSELSKLRDILAEFVGVDGRFTSTVKALYIYLHNEALTYNNNNTGIIESYRIVDTPGVNDPIVSRQRQTERFLQEAHAVFMLTRADTFLPDADVKFMNAHISSEGVSKILLVANKLDLLFATDGRCPNDLEDAIDYEVKQLENQLSIRGGNLNREPIALCCTAGIAECIRLKLLNDYENPNLNEDEKGSLKLLRQKFPDNFKDKESTLDALDMIADFPTIIEDYVQGSFLENKDRIIDEKISDFIECHRDAIMNDFRSIIEEVDKELSVAKDCDTTTIASQISALITLQQIAIPKMQTRIKVFSKSLKETHVVKLFETKEELLQYKPILKEDCTDFKSISYTRETTFFGRTKSGVMYADVINPSSVSKSEDKQIDNLRDQVNKKWTKIYNSEEDSLKKELLDTVKEIANRDPSLHINVDIYEMIIMSCITEKLCGKSQLRLEDKCSEQKSLIADYVNLSDHTNFDRSFGEMSEDDADDKIRKQAEEKLKNFKLGMRTRNDSVYKELRKEVELHCESINSIMKEFANNLTEKLEEQLNEIKTEKEKSRKSIDEICNEIVERKNSFVELQNIFKQL